MATADLGKVRGQSAYEAWLAQGHTGTIDDFLNRTTLPTMSDTQAGVAKLGRGLYIDDGTLNVTGFIPHIDDDVDWSEIKAMCQQHQLPVGTIITSTWYDTVNGVLYDFPWIVADNRVMKDEDGIDHTGSILIAKYSPARDVQFDAGNKAIWGTSDIRLWLNSDGAAGQWWTPQIESDTEPAWAAGMPGFLREIPQDMRDVILPVQIETNQSGTTVDTMWLPSYSQVYCSSTSEQGSLEWFSSLCQQAGFASPTTSNVPARIITKIDAKNTGNNTWTRSYYNTTSAYYLTATGGRANNYANTSYRSLPACFIG